MARKCKIVKDKFRAKLSSAAKVTREALRIMIKKSADYEETIEAVRKLNKRPRNESACRLRRRCRICGRPRGVYKKFGLCRCCLRKLFTFGLIPGVKKASW